MREIMRDDASYFYDRAETELELAQRAIHPSAVRAHYIIANHYLDRCYGGKDEPEAQAEAEATADARSSKGVSAPRNDMNGPSDDRAA